MKLSIDTTDNKKMTIGLADESGKNLVVKEIATDFNQAEKLLPSVIRIIDSKKTDLKKIKKIVVPNTGGSFTSLRIGVVTANALGYALNIPVEGEKVKPRPETGEEMMDFDVVEPLYSREPNITIKKS